MTPALEKIVAKMTIQELVATRDEFQVLITEKQEEEKTRLLASFQELAEQAGLTVAEVVAKLQPASTGGKSDKVRNPAKPKYQNPADENETWTGRGRKPHWVQNFLAEHDWQEGDDKETKNTILEKVLIEQA